MPPNKTPTTTLVRASPKPAITNVKSIAKIGETILASIGEFANVLSTITDKQLPSALTFTKELGAVIGEYDEALKTRIKALVLKDGKPITDKGSITLTIEGYELQLRPLRTGFDPKQVEAMLRAKSLPVEKYMDMDVKYKCSDLKLANLVGAGLITMDELETCRPEKSYAVITPKKVG